MKSIIEYLTEGAQPKRPGFIRRNIGKIALGAGALGAAGLAYSNRDRLGGAIQGVQNRASQVKQSFQQGVQTGAAGNVKLQSQPAAVPARQPVAPTQPAQAPAAPSSPLAAPARQPAAVPAQARQPVAPTQPAPAPKLTAPKTTTTVSHGTYSNPVGDLNQATSQVAQYNKQLSADGLSSSEQRRLRGLRDMASKVVDSHKPAPAPRDPSIPRDPNADWAHED